MSQTIPFFKTAPAEVSTGVWEVGGTPEKRYALALAMADRKNRANLYGASHPYRPTKKDYVGTDAPKDALKKERDRIESEKSFHASNIKAVSGQDGAYHKQVNTKGQDGQSLNCKNDKGELVPAVGDYKQKLGKKNPQRSYSDPHSHRYYTPDGEVYGGEETRDPSRPGETKWVAPLTAKRSGHRHVPLKVSASYDPKTGDALPDDEDNIRSKGWATGRHRDKIRAKLDASANSEYVPSHTHFFTRVKVKGQDGKYTDQFKKVSDPYSAKHDGEYYAKAGRDTVKDANGNVVKDDKGNDVKGDLKYEPLKVTFHKNDRAYFAKNPEKKPAAALAYQFHHERDGDTMRAVSDLADNHKFGDVDPKMLKKAKLVNDKIKRIVGSEEEKKRNIGKAANAGTAAYKEKGVGVERVKTNTPERSPEEIANTIAALEKDAKTMASPVFPTRSKKKLDAEKKEKEKRDAENRVEPDYANYNAAVIKLNARAENNPTLDRDRELKKLKSEYGVREEVIPIDRTPKMRALLEDLRTVLS